MMNGDISFRILNNAYKGQFMNDEVQGLSLFAYPLTTFG
jgi:hypothetical protein